MLNTMAFSLKPFGILWIGIQHHIGDRLFQRQVQVHCKRPAKVLLFRYGQDVFSQQRNLLDIVAEHKAASGDGGLVRAQISDNEHCEVVAALGVANEIVNAGKQALLILLDSKAWVKGLHCPALAKLLAGGVFGLRDAIGIKQKAASCRKIAFLFHVLHLRHHPKREVGQDG